MKTRTCLQTAARFAIKTCVYFWAWLLYIFPSSKYHSLDSLHISTLPFSVSFDWCLFEWVTFLLLRRHSFFGVVHEGSSWHDTCPMSMIEIITDHRPHDDVSPWWSSLVSGHSGPGHPMCQLVTRDTGHYELQVRSATLAPLTIHWHHDQTPKFSDHSPLSLSSLLITNWSLYTRPGPALYRQLDHFTRGDVLMDTRNRPEQTLESLYP